MLALMFCGKNSCETPPSLPALLACLALMSAAQAQTVLITGSNRGIGLEFAKQYADKGWTVIATHRRDTTPDTLATLEGQYPPAFARKKSM